ncbi:MAG: hypothetical protein M1817_006456 [Caeruleum heppii]|nr:MAG: hypothetical protein M1817_006456 [Caeruleum heppii]
MMKLITFNDFFSFNTSIVSLYVVFAILSSAQPTDALRVSPKSSCASVCLASSSVDDANSTASTAVSGAEIVCRDPEYTGTDEGQSFKACEECLAGSATLNGPAEFTELFSFLYNIRFAFSYCLYGVPDNAKVISTPCVVSCQPLQSSVTTQLISNDTSDPYEYCQGPILDGVSKCASCLNMTSDERVLGNFITTLSYACQRRPSTITALGLPFLPFTTRPLPQPSSSTSPASTAASPSGSSALSPGAKVGLGLGLTAFVLLLSLGAGFLWKWRAARRNRRSADPFLDERFGNPNISAPVPGFISPENRSRSPSAAAGGRALGPSAPWTFPTGAYPLAPYNPARYAPASAVGPPPPPPVMELPAPMAAAPARRGEKAYRFGEQQKRIKEKDRPTEKIASVYDWRDG